MPLALVDPIEVDHITPARSGGLALSPNLRATHTEPAIATVPNEVNPVAQHQQSPLPRVVPGIVVYTDGHRVLRPFASDYRVGQIAEVAVRGRTQYWAAIAPVASPLGR